MPVNNSKHNLKIYFTKLLYSLAELIQCHSLIKCIPLDTCNGMLHKCLINYEKEIKLENQSFHAEQCLFSYRVVNEVEKPKQAASMHVFISCRVVNKVGKPELASSMQVFIYCTVVNKVGKPELASSMQVSISCR